jgi:tetratricopeptide (TPR) repeat protein/DNA-binding CsgD family transcriptional regulator
MYQLNRFRNSLLVLTWLFCLCNESAANDTIANKIKELYKGLYSAGSDTAKVNAALDIFRNYQFIRLDSLFILAKRTYTLSKSINFKQANTIKALGIAYSLNGDYLNSNKYLIEAYYHIQKSGDKKLMCSILSALGSNYFKLNDNKKALEYFSKAFELSYDYRSKIITLLNLGQTHANSNNYPEALQYLNEALKLAENEKNKLDIAITYNRLGELYYTKDDYNQSLVWFYKAFKMDIPDQFFEFKINSMNGIARGYYYTHRFSSGIKIAEKALAIAVSEKSIQYQVLMYHLLSCLYDSAGRPDQALYYFRQYVTLNDSLFDSKKTEQINFLNTEFETTQKELRIAVLEKEAGFNRILTRVYFIIAGLVLLALFLIILSYRQKNRLLIFEKKSLEHEKIKEALEKEQLKIKLFEKDREMLSKILQINQQKEALSYMLQEANKILKEDTLVEVHNSVKQLNSNIAAKISLCDDWNQIKLHFDNVHPGFFSNLKSNSADLTPVDLKLCAYTKLNFSVKEISRLLNINHRSVIMARYRLKKKFNIPEEISFDHFIESN